MGNTNTVPSAEELMKGCEHDGSYIPVSEVKRLMNLSTRLHLEAMRDEICKEVKVKPPTLESTVWCEVDKQSVIEAANTYIKNNKL